MVVVSVVPFTVTLLVTGISAASVVETDVLDAVVVVQEALFPDTGLLLVLLALTPTTGAITRLRASAAASTFFMDLLLIIVDSSLHLKHLFFIFIRKSSEKNIYRIYISFSLCL